MEKECGETRKISGGDSIIITKVAKKIYYQANGSRLIKKAYSKRGSGTVAIISFDMDLPEDETGRMSKKAPIRLATIKLRIMDLSGREIILFPSSVFLS